jgi:serine/threonine protein kinase
MELAAGTLVTENVRLIAPLGEGGMGSVWSADHLALRTRVAVKFIAQELLEDDPDMVKRFRREAGAAARIKSPHVVQTLDHGVMNDGTPYIVMELLEGESLAQRLERVGTLPLETIAEIIAQVARGLGKAHAAGIVHRDIKPDNVFLVGSDEDELFIKLLDFGVAKHTGVQSHSVVTGTGAMIGTPGYMSPEQVLTGKHVDHRSDLWSLAVVVYHAMIGDIPFQGETFGALCVSITRGQHLPPSRARAGIPPSLDAWMARGLALEPKDRFQSAKELAVTLREAVRGNSNDDEKATLQRPSPLYRTSQGTVALGTVVIPTPPTTEAPTLALPPDKVEPEVETRRRERAARPSRVRWLVAGVVAILGFLSGFLIVMVVRPKQSREIVSPMTSIPTITSEPELPQPQKEDTPEPTKTTAAPRPRQRPTPAPAPEPTVAPLPPAPHQKDRGF